ncbi:MAG: recombinase family protein [Hyphomicrobiaceae bacterium]|nr:recombinase family protein [Hyphomicrobiaceae bacterium]
MRFAARAEDGKSKSHGSATRTALRVSGSYRPDCLIAASRRAPSIAVQPCRERTVSGLRREGDSRLMESGVEVRFCDLPQIEGPTGRFMLQQMPSVAELEAGLIADRTRKALAAAKDRVAKLGGLRVSKGGRVIPAGESPRFTLDDASKSLEIRRAAAKGRAADLVDTLEAIRAEGVTTARGIAKALTDRGIPTARGGSVWQAVQVQRLLALDAV